MTASLPASGWSASSKITGVGLDPPNALEQAERVSNKTGIIVLLNFIIYSQGFRLDLSFDYVALSAPLRSGRRESFKESPSLAWV